MASDLPDAPLQPIPSAPALSTASPRMTALSDAGSRASPSTLERVDRDELSNIASAGLKTSPRLSSKTLRGLSPRFSPKPMTAAAAHADEKRAREERDSTQQSVNPAANALGVLLGQDVGMSRPQDAPTATTTLSEGLSIAANAVSVPDPMQVDANPQVSPVSMSSLGSFNSAAPTAALNSTSAPSSRTTNPPVEAERNGLVTSSGPPLDPSDDPSNPDDRPANRALTFPGQTLKDAAPGEDPQSHSTPLRGMSLPMPRSEGGAGRSPTSNRKHKCPYCSTDFTRHHNLKSHLLTHSHEKPFVCSTCQLRFRRLHDLKRHNKLHTGERPHVCPRCDRSFARGDALARHNKGHGGCAGRRASMGSGFGGEGEYDEGSHDGQGPLPDQSGGRGESMDGLLYTGNASNHADRMDEDGDLAEERRRLSLPSIKAHDAPPNAAAHADAASARGGAYPPSQAQQQPPPPHPSQHPSSYPPTGRPGGVPASNAFHLPANRSSAATSPSIQPNSFSPKPFAPTAPLHPGGPSSIFSQTGMTESPKPISPGAAASHQLGHPPAASDAARRHRSPSLTEQLRQQQYGRRGSARSPPAMGLPPLSNNAHAPHLPSLPGLAPPDSRYTLSSNQSGGGGGGVQPGVPSGAATTSSGGAYHASGLGGSGSSLASASAAGGTTGSHSHADSGSSHAQTSSGDGSNNLFASGADGLWAYIRNLEERVNRLTDEVTTLRKECAHHTSSTTGAGAASRAHEAASEI